MSKFDSVPGIAELVDEVDGPGYDHKKAMKRLNQINELAEARCKALGNALHAEMLQNEALQLMAPPAGAVIEADSAPLKAVGR